MNEDRPVQKLSEAELKTAFSGVLSDKMQKADWYYEYSDDHQVWMKGANEIGKIKEDLVLLSRLDGGLDEAKKLWERHAPSNSVHPPGFFHDPGKLHTVLNGVIMRQDMPAVQEILQEQQRSGNRFVAFDSEPLALPKDRFTGFSSAIAARDFVYENSTPKKQYIAEPIARMLKDMEQVLAPNKEKLLQEVAERLQEYQQEGKRSRGPELSR